MKSVIQLLSEITASDDLVRIEAAKALGSVRSQRALDQAVPALCLLARESTDPGVRWAATYALTWTGDERAVGPLLATLRDAGAVPRVRGQAAEGLGELFAGRADDTVVAALLEALDSPAPEVRFWSAFALGKIGDRRALPALRTLAATDRAVLPGWWAVGKEAADAVAAIEAKGLGPCL